MISTPEKPTTGDSDADHISVELSARRTGMSFQRTRMSADRTLMSVIRTSLSLIGFGFTLYQVFEKMRDAGVVRSAAAPRRLGETLVILGIVMLVLGIGYHVMFMIGLRKERDKMRLAGLIHGESAYPASMTLMTAIILLVIGLVVIVSMVGGAGPLS
jgi:putative membrane protein